MADDRVSERERDIVLSAQRSLFEYITPNLRGVAADWDDHNIRIVAYFDGPFSDETKEDLNCAHTEIATDFIDLANVELTLERADMPAPMRHHRTWIYLRHE